MTHRGFLACLVVMLALPAWSQESQDPQELVTGAQAYLEGALADEYVGVEPSDIAVTVSNLDSRLRLTRCDKDVSYSIASPRPYGSNVSLKVQCAGTKPWSIYVPAKIDTFAPIAVASRNMSRGDIITHGDVQLIRMNTAQAGFGYVSDLSRILGMELKRRLQAGEPVRLSHVKAAEVIKKGDKVVIEATTGGVSVLTNAKALAAGEVGDQIQVMNVKSNRVVDATVVGPGRVKVSL